MATTRKKPTSDSTIKQNNLTSVQNRTEELFNEAIKENSIGIVNKLLDMTMQAIEEIKKNNTSISETLSSQTELTDTYKEKLEELLESNNLAIEAIQNLSEEVTKSDIRIFLNQYLTTEFKYWMVHKDTQELIMNHYKKVCFGDVFNEDTKKWLTKWQQGIKWFIVGLTFIGSFFTYSLYNIYSKNGTEVLQQMISKQALSNKQISEIVSKAIEEYDNKNK